VAPSSFAATAGTREAGELFEYSFAAPVTVKQGESAMLPFLQQKIGARKLLVYSKATGSIRATRPSSPTTPGRRWMVARLRFTTTNLRRRSAGGDAASGR